MKDTITIMAQAFYGNRTVTDIKLEDLPYFLLGIFDKSIYTERDRKLDVTVVKLPVEGCALVYNKYEEEDKMNTGRKPLADVPELNLTLYSRCILCGIDDEGNLTSLVPEKSRVAVQYLSI